jgi:hypothetical protein
MERGCANERAVNGRRFRKVSAASGGNCAGTGLEFGGTSIGENLMTRTAAQKAELKQKAKHEGRELLVIFLYLAFFFCSLATYNILLLREYHVEQYWNFAFALINALVVAKVILIGEYAHVGKRHEDKPLFVSAIWKAFLFGLLVFAFHVVEEVIKRLIHGADVATASRDIRIDELLARSLIVFCTFIPLFAFREFRRKMGEEEFHAMVFGSREKG